MHIDLKHHEGKWPTFDINLYAAKGNEEPFLTIKGCRIVDGKNGAFVSYPARKDEKTGKYWPYAYGGEKFNAHILSLAIADQDRKPAPRNPRQGLDDDLVPF